LSIVSPSLERFARKWRETTNSTALTRLAKSLDLSPQKADITKSASQLGDDTLVMWAEKEAGGICSTITSGGTTFLHIALRVGIWNSIKVFVEELESIGQLADYISTEADGVNPKLMAFEMLSLAVKMDLSEDELWEVIIAGSLLDILVVACQNDKELETKVLDLFAFLDSVNSVHRRRFEVWHIGPFGSKYDEDYDFAFP
jgi:hypothetical protein